MKRTWIVVVLAMAAAAGYSLDLSVGVKCTARYSTFLGDDWKIHMGTGERAPFWGWGGGGFVTLGFLDWFALEPEVLILRLGGEYVEEGIGSEIFGCPYLSANVLAKARLGVLSVFAGPAGMIPVGTGKEIFYPEVGQPVGIDYPGGAIVPLFAVTGGIGYEHAIGRWRVIAELRGIYSLTPWYNQHYNTDDWRLFAALLVVGCSFRVGQ
jgi:hypothetical protein